MDPFDPSPFRPHPIFRGGHLQTLAVVGEQTEADLSPTPIVIPVSEGDSVVLHEDLPVDGDGLPADTPDATSVLLIHGLTGCHAAPYMVRLADRFRRIGMRVYRMDMRGIGSAFELSQNFSHAGRSDDVIAALDTIANRGGDGPMVAIGVSLGGGQLIRAIGRIDGGIDPTPVWRRRLAGIAAVSPPLDLKRCSDNMQRRLMRPYNRYFINLLLGNVPPRVGLRADFQARMTGPRPRTMRQLDDWFTAPLSGFRDALDYYDQSSAHHVAGLVRAPALVLTARNDPIVPVACFADSAVPWASNTRLMISPSGGHVGFVQRRRNSWMDQVLGDWIGYLESTGYR